VEKWLERYGQDGLVEEHSRTTSRGSPGEQQHTRDTIQVNLVEITVRQVGSGLMEAFNDWLDVNKGKINPRLYAKLKKQLGKARTTSIPSVVGLALWMFGVMNNVGCVIALGPYGSRIVRCDGYDKNTTERLATMIHTALQLQALDQSLLKGLGPP